MNKHFKDICDSKKNVLSKTINFDSRYPSQDSKDEKISNCQSSCSFIKSVEKDTPILSEKKKAPFLSKKSDFFTFCNQSQITAIEDVNSSSKKTIIYLIILF